MNSPPLSIPCHESRHQLPGQATTFDRDLELLYLDYLGRSAGRITVSIESSQEERRAGYLRMVNYQVTVGKLMTLDLNRANALDQNVTTMDWVQR